MEYDKPVILIGLLPGDDVLLRRAEEVAWGIEEEWCLFEKYFMKDNLDIHYSSCETTVILLKEEGQLYVQELNKSIYLLKTEGNRNVDYRILGKNAARYLKKLKLSF